MGKEKHYKAFISYSHDDEVFGSWLHKELEKYKIPKKLREDYPNLPKTLYPIFRDRYELNAGDDLGIEIPKALKNSDALIVVCSINSANSKWVNQEIIEFKKLHGEDRIFPIIIDGEPFAKESDKFDDSLECFPDALKYTVNRDGRLTAERTSILASSTIEKEDGRELAKLKLIAGILGIPFGEFYRRDEEQKKKDRNKNITIWSFVFILMAGLAVFSWVQKNIAVVNEKKMKKELFNNKIQRGIQERDFLHNHLNEKFFFAEAISLSSTNDEAKIAKILYNQNKIVLKNIYEHNTSKHGCWGAIFSKNEEKILSWSGNLVKLWNTNSDKVIINIEHNSTVQGAIFNKPNNKILSWGDDRIIKLWNSHLRKESFVKQTPTVIYNAFFNKEEDGVVYWGNNTTENISFISYFNIKDKKIIYEKILNDSLNDVVLDEDNILYWGKFKYPSDKGYLKIDNIKDKKNLISLEFNSSVHGALYNKNKSKLLIWTSYSIKIFDLITSKIIFSTNGDDWILNAKFNNDENQILVLYGRPSNWQKNVKLWSISNSKKPLFVWEHDFSFIHGAIFNKDNTKVLTYGDDGNVKLWSTEDGTLIKELCHKDKVSGAKFLDNDKKILSWTGVNTNIESNNESLIYLWDIDFYKKNILFTIKDNGIINDIKVSKDEKKILTYGSENIVKLWLIKNSKIIKNLNNQEATSIIKSCSKKINELTSYYKNIDIKFFKKLQLPYNSEEITHFILNHEKNKILFASDSGDIILWDLENKKELLKFSHSNSHNINGILFSLDEEKIFSWGEDGIIKLWDIKSKKLLKTFQDEISIKNIILSKKDTNKFYSWSGTTSNIPSGKGTVRIWDTREEIPIQILRKDINGETGISGISLNQDESLLISWVGGGFNLNIWDTKNGINLLKLDLDSDVEYAEFINSDRDILIIKDTYTKNIVQILHLYDEKIPNKFYILKTQVETGAYMTQSEEIKALSKKEWLQKKKEYEQILKEQPQ